MKRVHLAAVLAIAGAFGCDKEPKPAADTVEAAAPRPPETATAPAPSGPLPLRVDADKIAIGGASFEGPSAAVDAARACVAGPCGKDVVAIEATRTAKPSKVAALVAELKAAGAKSVTIKTPVRDNTYPVLPITLASLPVPDCTTVAFLGKDGGTSVWRAGGGTAKKYNRGFAGPDMTLGTEGVRKAAAKCESPLLLVGADDAMIWGLVVDLVAIARAGVDGGAGLKPTELGIVQSTAVAGRKITADDWR